MSNFNKTNSIVSNSSSSSSSNVVVATTINSTNQTTTTTISTGNGNTKMASRRIFPPEFKLKVLEAYHNDPECKGNQRATARKFGIHRRQIQKWLQSENILRSSITSSCRNVKQFHNVTMTSTGTIGTGIGVTNVTSGSGGTAGCASPGNDSNNNVGSTVVSSSSGNILRRKYNLSKRDQQIYHGQPLVHHHHHHQQQQHHHQQQQQHTQSAASFKINLVPLTTTDRGRQNVATYLQSQPPPMPLPLSLSSSSSPSSSSLIKNEDSGVVAGQHEVPTSAAIQTNTIKQELMEPVVGGVSLYHQHHHQRHHHHNHHNQNIHHHHFVEQQQQQQQRLTSEEDLSTTTTTTTMSVSSSSLPLSLACNDGAMNTITTSVAKSPRPILVQRSPDRLYSIPVPSYASFPTHHYTQQQQQPVYDQFERLHHQHHQQYHYNNNHNHDRYEVTPFKCVLAPASSSSSSSSPPVCLPLIKTPPTPPTTTATTAAVNQVDEVRDYQPMRKSSENYVPSTAGNKDGDKKRDNENYESSSSSSSSPSLSPPSSVGVETTTATVTVAAPIDLSLNNSNRNNSFSHEARTPSMTKVMQQSQSSPLLTSKPLTVTAVAASSSCGDALNLTQYDRRKRHATSEQMSMSELKMSKLDKDQNEKDRVQKPVKLFKPYALDNEEKESLLSNTTNKSEEKPIIWNNHLFPIIPSATPLNHHPRDCYSALEPHHHHHHHHRHHQQMSPVSGTSTPGCSFHGVQTDFTFPLVNIRPSTLFQSNLVGPPSSTCNTITSTTTTTTTTTINGSLAISRSSSSNSSSSSSSSSSPPATIQLVPKSSPIGGTSGYDSAASAYSDSSDYYFHGSITPPIAGSQHPFNIGSCSPPIPAVRSGAAAPTSATGLRSAIDTDIHLPMYSVDFKLQPLYYYYDSPPHPSPSSAPSPPFSIDWSSKLTLMAK